MAVSLSTKGLKKLADAALSGLAGPMKGNTDPQYVILRVVPVEDTTSRGVPSVTTTVTVVGVEPALTPDDRREVRDLMDELTLARKRLSPQGDQQELPLGDEDAPTGVADGYHDL